MAIKYGTEKRSFPRYKTHYHFSTQLYNSVLSRAVLKNISASGVAFQTRKCMLSDELISLVFDRIGSKTPIVLKGRIVWAQSQSANVWDIGFEFVGESISKVQSLLSDLNIST